LVDWLVCYCVSSLRYTIGQQRLDSLSLLAIERDLANIIEYNDVIGTFAECKARKKTNILSKKLCCLCLSVKKTTNNMLNFLKTSLLRDSHTK